MKEDRVDANWANNYGHGLPKKKRDPQPESSFDYAAKSLATSADTGADFTLIMLMERNIQKCTISAACPLFTHIETSYQKTKSIPNLSDIF